MLRKASGIPAHHGKPESKSPIAVSIGTLILRANQIRLPEGSTSAPVGLTGYQLGTPARLPCEPDTSTLPGVFISYGRASATISYPRPADRGHLSTPVPARQS
jgi:hypothetical protein